MVCAMTGTALVARINAVTVDRWKKFMNINALQKLRGS
jgi:hypothetical protein